MKIGIALSGGANKGSWCQGAVSAITERYGKDFNLVAGTSIGGVVGACLASGMPDDDSWAWWESMTWGKVTNPRFPPIFSGLMGSSFYSDAKMKKIFAELFPRRFSDLRLPLAVTACNLMAGLGDDPNIVIREGDLRKALLATVAIPAVFPPVDWGAKLLIDGGIGNYIPLEIFKGFDLIFAVLCGYGVPPEKPKTAIEIVSRSFEMAVQDEIEREIAEFSDKKTRLVVIQNRRPDILTASMMDWLHGREWLRWGFEDGLAVVDEL